jgi:hypothetical protein
MNNHVALLLATSCGINAPLGYARRPYAKFSWEWLMLIHASLPLVIPLRKRLCPAGPKWVVPVNIACCVLGQLLGSACHELVNPLTRIGSEIN